jgi:predicted DsbA family dithiol-disulfide isomerase
MWRGLSRLTDIALGARLANPSLKCVGNRKPRRTHTEGKQNEIVAALFRAYFTEGRDIGKHSVLADLAAEAGLPRERASDFLRSDHGSAEVSEEEAQARRLGISGVPTILVGGAPLFSGALRAEIMAAKLREASLSHAA